MFFTIKDILGEVAKCAVKQSPYVYPNNLDIVLETINNICQSYQEAGCLFFEDRKSLDDFLYEHLLKIDEVKKWNESKNKSEKNIFVSAFNYPQPDDDFIDLDALIRNIVNGLLKEI